jgi:hypothetical protein
MKRLGFILSLLVIGIYLTGCVSSRSTTRETAQIVLREEAADKDDRRSEEMNSLKNSVALLRSDIDNLRKEMQRLKDLELSFHRVGSEMIALEDRFRKISIRPPLTAHRLPGEVFLCGERIPLEAKGIRENLEREFLLSLGNEAAVLLWIKRARRYFPHIEKTLKAMDLPDDLKYLTITESSLWPYAVSSSAAAGIWQFIPSTGEKYGMRKNKEVDERFDFFEATEGGLAYLKSLYEEFRNWALAMAAYNSGENRVRKEIQLQGVRDYYFLDLPLQTERYVYKIAVAKIILSDPKKYGFHLDEKDLYDPLEADRIQLELTQALPVIEIAAALGVYYKDIKELNLHLSGDAVPPGIHYLNLPPGTSQRFWIFFSMWKKGLEGR